MKQKGLGVEHGSRRHRGVTLETSASPSQRRYHGGEQRRGGSHTSILGLLLAGRSTWVAPLKSLPGMVVTEAQERQSCPSGKEENSECVLVKILGLQVPEASLS
jgi:hypothetical protein